MLQLRNQVTIWNYFLLLLGIKHKIYSAFQHNFLLTCIFIAAHNIGAVFQPFYSRNWRKSAFEGPDTRPLDRTRAPNVGPTSTRSVPKLPVQGVWQAVWPAPA